MLVFKIARDLLVLRIKPLSNNLVRLLTQQASKIDWFYKLKKIGLLSQLKIKDLTIK